MGTATIAAANAQKNILPSISVKHWNKRINEIQSIQEYSCDYYKATCYNNKGEVWLITVFHISKILIINE